jgi:ribokinase
MSQKSILVVGSLNMDQVVRVSRIPLLGETLLGAGSLKLVPGGKGANQAVAMARLGARVAMAGRVGNDVFGERLRKSLEADHVDTSLVAIDQEEASGVAFIFLAPDGDNAIVVASGANMRVGLYRGDEQAAAIDRAIAQAQAMVLQLEIPLETVSSLVARAYAHSVPVTLNLAPAQPISQETLRQLTTLILNETEASILTGQTVKTLEDAQIVATVLQEQVISTVVITLGSEGAILAGKDSNGKKYTIHQPAPRVQVIDTTAAGDCFVAALTVAFCEGQEPASALRFAIYASALKVTKFGAQPGLPTRKEVDDFLRRA